jgi:ribosomal protein L7/L12
MPNTFQCPSCSGSIEYTENNKNMDCPFCGTAVTTPGPETASEAAPGVAATVVIPKVEREPAPVAAAQTMIQQSRFNSTAEIIDEVKRLLREDDKTGAVKVYRKEFNVSQADAKTAVDQIEIDMQHSGKEETPPPPASVETPPPPPPPPPAPSEPAISGDVVFDAAPPQKPSSKRGWIIGCSIAFVLFCCFCVILPTVIWYVKPLLTK